MKALFIFLIIALFQKQDSNIPTIDSLLNESLFHFKQQSYLKSIEYAD